VNGVNVAATQTRSGTPEARGPVTTAESLSWLYERYREEVYHLALRYGRGNAAWAEDVTQDVFLRLFRTPKVLREHETLSGWFYRVTTNRCLNKLRADALRRSLPLHWLWGDKMPCEQTPEAVALARDELARAFDAMNALPIKERAVFFMHHVDGKEQVEVARVLGHSKGYVSKLLKRAEERLTAAGWKVEHGRR
jgi:RNA polymerase sigma-70 factor (ECF subfamily)